MSREDGRPIAKVDTWESAHAWMFHHPDRTILVYDEEELKELTDGLTASGQRYEIR